jgi:DNA-binding transcriptional regulator YiaG
MKKASRDDPRMSPEAIRAILAKMNISQAEAARQVGVNDRTMRRWVLGECPISVSASKLLINMSLFGD